MLARDRFIIVVFSFSGNYVLNYLATRPKLVHYVTQALVQVSVAWDEGLFSITVNPEIFARILFSQIALNNIFTTLKNCD